MSEMVHSDGVEAQVTPQQRLRDKLSVIYGGDDNLKQIIDGARGSPTPDEDLEELHAIYHVALDPEEALKREIEAQDCLYTQLDELNKLVGPRWPSLIRFDTNGRDANGYTAWRRPGFWKVRTLDEPKRGWLKRTKAVKLDVPGEGIGNWVENEDECGYWIPAASDPVTGKQADAGLLLLADGYGTMLYKNEVQDWESNAFLLPADNIDVLDNLPVDYTHINNVLGALKDAMTNGTPLEPIATKLPASASAAAAVPPAKPTQPVQPRPDTSTFAEQDYAALELSDFPK